MVVSVIAALVTTAAPAAATDVNGEYCGYKDDVRPRFAGSEWSELTSDGQSFRQSFELGIDSWQAKDNTGSEIFTQDGAYFDIDFVFPIQLGAGLDALGINSGDPAAMVVCATNPAAAILGGVKVAVNKNRVAAWKNGTSGTLAGLAAHEWGHVLGFGHSGGDDAQFGGIPTMATCLGDFGGSGADRLHLSSDDAAAALAGRTPIGSYQNVTANSSFEDGWKFWEKRNGTVWVQSGGAVLSGTSKASGFKNVVVSPNNQNNTPMLISRTIVTKMDDHGTVANPNLYPAITVNRDTVRAEVVARKFDTSDSGSLLIQVSARAYDLPDLAWPGRTGCNFYSDDKNGAPVRIAPWRTASVYCYLETWWQECSTGAKRITKQQAGFNDLDAAEVKLRVKSNIYSAGGTRAEVTVARANAEVDFVA